MFITWICKRRALLWLVTFALTTVVVLLSVKFLDRPASLLAERRFGNLKIIDRLSDTPSLFFVIPILLISFLVVSRITIGSQKRIEKAVVTAFATTLILGASEPVLKFMFARTWPKYAYPSFIHEGAYGFHPFHFGYAYQSFPSGHSSAVSGILSVAYLFFPQYRWFYAIALISICVVLVATNYHFISDVIAGVFWGASVGWLCFTIEKKFLAESA